MNLITIISFNIGPMSLYQSYSFTLLTIVLLPIFSCQQQAPSTVQTKIPTRVITLTPSNTELVAAIAGVEVLVGRDRFSTEPPAVKSIPVVGDFCLYCRGSLLLTAEYR